ncbi:NAD(P)H-dependent oxidoreductase [Cupriavidus sp. AU9028]|uniref:NAD(P)H-dependent oxidoreductase n=1 Tax=Cupriavidus sp. AU9028 TaxID=2871157 RepID=UPI001C96C6C3|nr:NAD(P)H-dependent oxidoreductase [Cupriavidus sp. AU9028]MBY4898518.1 NAD(P)H-dependent oxidoreductase [Cupriavidus sp. AU9028]
MHALIVVSHPNPKSLTHAVGEEIGLGLSASGQTHTFEIADLAAEGFDPRFTAADLALHLREAPPPPDVAAEHARLERADALVLVFPVYWWSFPGMLKGWIDRVFTNGWAYEEEPGGKTVKKLGHLAVHLVGIGGANMGTYDRHGYANAMKTQIDHGIFGYCGAPVATSELLLPSDFETATSHIARARQIGQHLFS